MSRLARYYRSIGVTDPVGLADHTRALWRAGVDAREDEIAIAALAETTRIFDRPEVAQITAESEARS